MAFRSIRTKLQTTFVALAVAAIAITGYVASTDASSALRTATLDRLTAIRATREHALERYFGDLRRNAVALSNDESTLSSLDQWRRLWDRIPTPDSGPQQRSLRVFYERELAGAFEGLIENLHQWLPKDPRTISLQHCFLALNSHPPGSRDLLVDCPQLGDYGSVHARYHPVFHRYLNAFGVYDLFLISVPEGRILYTVMKEVDLGVSLSAEPYRSTSLARAFRRAAELRAAGTIIEDYAPYVASHFAPAAFVASPVQSAGATVGVLAMQVSIREVDRVITGDRHWRDEGLGATGQAYIVGPDSRLRSDLRLQMEKPDDFYRGLEQAQVSPLLIRRVRTSGTSVLTLPVDLSSPLSADRRGARVLRSTAPLSIPELKWTLVAEIDETEALAPVRTLHTRVLTTGIVLALIFLAASTWLGASIARPVRTLANAAARLGRGELATPIQPTSHDEVGQLEIALDRMREDLRRTTVSKRELEVLAGRLISAQEEERAKVARELHDDLVQRLAALAIEAGRLAKMRALNDPAWSAAIDNLKRRLAGISDDVHGLSRRLHPAMLDDLGLEAALESECRAFVERGGPPVDLRLTGPLDHVSPGTRLALYRIAQEGLRNIQRHAGASDVSLHLNSSRDAVQLELRDDGRGLDRTSPDWRPGLGLASIEERTRLLGGTFELHSRPGEGTRIVVNLPCAAPNEEAESTPR